MTKFSLALPFLLIALPLAGCSGGTQNRGLESVHQPVVERQNYAFDVATDGDGLAPGEQARLEGWMQSLRVGYGDRVSVDGNGGNPALIRDAVATQVARYGLLLSDDVPVTGAAIAPGTARIVVSRMHASVPHCPDWSRDVTNDFDNNTSSNQGCAVNSNLASMVANPGDLVRGEPGSGTTDPATSNRAITLYRNAAPTGGGGTSLQSAGGTAGGSGH